MDTGSIKDRHFFSFAEAKEAVAEKLKELNNRPFQKRLGCRRSAYEDEEREFMQPLPVSPYELATWRTASVPSDYCISDGLNRYSIPFDLIGEKVDIRLTKDIVEDSSMGTVSLRTLVRRRCSATPCRNICRKLTVNIYPTIRMHFCHGDRDWFCHTQNGRILSIR
ncbi:Mu transposase domain-containing protein [Robinsoniella peoriensis]|uniref:Mu transposase domain-containing protein n=1 Tax=Robinsoniella peoriensis TaxID=180332 RepID=UPI003A7F3B85